MILTDEQKLIISEARNGKSLIINAFAGTGKTSTLVQVAKELTNKIGLYLAYNRAIKESAENKFSRNVVCKTSHALAYSKMFSLINGRIKNLNFYNFKTEKKEQYNIALLAIKILRLFCCSALDNLDVSILSHKDLIPYTNKKEMLERALEIAGRYWLKCWEPKSNYLIEHDFYLKKFQLDNYNLPYDFILFDEGQDANPVLLSILRKQKTQIIYVGDRHQQIYSWRGAINALDNLAFKRLYLTESFRFGEDIAALANNILKLKNENKILKGQKSINSKIVNEKPKTGTILSRTNAGVIKNFIELRGKKIHLIGQVDELLDLAKSAYALFCNKPKEVKNYKIKPYEHWGNMKELNALLPDPEISLMILLIERYRQGFSQIINYLEKERFVEEKDADYVLSTIHKAKGLEWDIVSVDDDFSILENDISEIKENLNNFLEEFNIIYVACTRAKNMLYLANNLKKFINKLCENGLND